MGRALMLDPQAAAARRTHRRPLPKYMEQIFQITRDVRDAGVSSCSSSSTPSRRLLRPRLRARHRRQPPRGQTRPAAWIAGGRNVPRRLRESGAQLSFMDFLNFHIVPGVVWLDLRSGRDRDHAGVRHPALLPLRHGDMATAGRFVALALVTAGLTPVALPIAMAAVAVVAIVVDKLFYDYPRQRPKIMTVMASARRRADAARGGAGGVRRRSAHPTPAASCARRILRHPAAATASCSTLAAVVAIVIGLTLFLRHSRWGKDDAGDVGQPRPRAAFGRG